MLRLLCVNDRRMKHHYSPLAEWYWQGKTKALQQRTSHSTTFSNIDPTWTVLRRNPRQRETRWVTSHLNHVIYLKKMCNFFPWCHLRVGTFSSNDFSLFPFSVMNKRFSATENRSSLPAFQGSPTINLIYSYHAKATSSSSLALQPSKFVLGLPHDIGLCPFCSVQSSFSSLFYTHILHVQCYISIQLHLSLPFSSLLLLCLPVSSLLFFHISFLQPARPFQST